MVSVFVPAVLTGYHMVGSINNEHLCHTVLETGDSKMKVQMNMMSGEGVLCWSALCWSDKIPEHINLRGGRRWYGSQFQKSQCIATRLHWFWVGGEVQEHEAELLTSLWSETSERKSKGTGFWERDIFFKGSTLVTYLPSTRCQILNFLLVRNSQIDYESILG